MIEKESKIESKVENNDNNNAEIGFIVNDNSPEENKNNEIPQEQENKENKNIFKIENKKRTAIFILFVLQHGFSSCDGGIIPQQHNNIVKDFGGNNEEKFGLFSSIDCIGRVIGAILLSFLINKSNRKFLVIFTIFFKAILLLVAVITKEYIPNLIFRCMGGLAQVFYTTYYPLWCDQYGKKAKKSLMVMSISLANVLGIILGYGIGMICNKFCSSSFQSWRASFAVQAVLMSICGFIFIIFDKNYFSEKFVMISDDEGNFVKNEKESFLKNFTSIICNKIFLFVTLSLCVSYYEIAVIKFYANTYMEKVLGLKEGTRLIFIVLLSVIGPITGLVIGGIIISKLGGYITRKSMLFLIIDIIVLAIISIFVPLFKITWVFVVTCWFSLFCIGASIPPSNGIIIASLPNHLRGDDFSLSNSLFNLLGNFPASYIYSLIVDAYEDKVGKPKNYQNGLLITEFYNFVGVILIVICGIFRFKIKGDLTGEQEKDISKNEIKIEQNEKNEKGNNEGDDKQIEEKI